MQPLLSAFCSVLLIAGSLHADDDTSEYFIESYPDHIQARLEIVDRLNEKQKARFGRAQLEGVVESGRIWRPGSIVTVAFHGGSDERLAKIATIAEEWTNHCNLKFSFKDENGRGFRRWSRTDATLTADIRVSFDEHGYWSLIGADSRDERLVGPGEASLNLEKFDESLPRNWEAIVLHEFGHAIGFHHEHQHPGVPCDFRWEDDDGYVLTRNALGEFVPDGENRRPGIYTVLSGPPNEWSRAKTAFNLRPLGKDSSAYILGKFDKKSIMLYSFPEWMFKDGKNSHCYHRLNTALSDQDHKIAAIAYPREQDLIRKRLAVIEAYERLKQGGDAE